MPAMAKRRKKRPLSRRLIGLAVRVIVLLVVLSILPVLILRWVAPPTSAFMVRYRLSGAPVDYRWVPLEEISPHAPLAVIASEDQNFFKHRGIDFKAVCDAIEDNRTRARPRGASTISQQVVKNLFLWPQRSYVRKGIEVYATLIMEIFWPKQRILEVYLNIAQMGNGVFGVEAASNRFFGKPAARLTRREAAALAAVLPGPASMHADRPSRYVRLRTRQIMKQMDLIGGAAFLKAHGI